MDELTPQDNGYECVDPALGEQLWRLEDPAREAPLADRLQNHLMICDACRLRSATHRKVAAGLTDGTLVLRRPGRAGPALAWGGGLAVAASLVLMLLLPPQARDSGRLARSADSPRFLRPVEGEVVGGGMPRLSWTPIPGATSYRLTVSEVDGDHQWRGETAATGLVVPESAELPLRRDYRALLETVPADLAPAGGVSVSFRTGSLAESLLYRLTASMLVLKSLAFAGLLLLAGSVIPRFSRR